MNDRLYVGLAVLGIVVGVAYAIYALVFDHPVRFRRDWRHLTRRPGVRLPDARDHTCAARFTRIMRRG